MIQDGWGNGEHCKNGQAYMSWCSKGHENQTCIRVLCNEYETTNTSTYSIVVVEYFLMSTSTTKCTRVRVRIRVLYNSAVNVYIGLGFLHVYKLQSHYPDGGPDRPRFEVSGNILKTSWWNVTPSCNIVSLPWAIGIGRHQSAYGPDYNKLFLLFGLDRAASGPFFGSGKNVKPS